MSGQKRYCTKCGTSLEENDKFCGSCGSPVKASPVASVAQPAVPPSGPAPQPVVPVQAPAASGETVAGAVAVSRKKGIFSIESFHIIVTSKRIICAAFTNEMVKQAAKEEGKSGFFSGMLGAATVGYTYYKKYLSMDPETALKENPQNFAIPLNMIRKVKFEMGSRHRDPQTKRETWDESKLDIETTGEKYSFKVPHQLHDQAAAVLRTGGLT
jgi:hypothetical protein